MQKHDYKMITACDLRQFDQDWSKNDSKAETFRQSRFQAISVGHEVTFDHQRIEAFRSRHLIKQKPLDKFGSLARISYSRYFPYFERNILGSWCTHNSHF